MAFVEIHCLASVFPATAKRNSLLDTKYVTPIFILAIFENNDLNANNALSSLVRGENVIG